MTDLWKEVTTWLSETTKSAIKETEDLALRGRVKMELLGINTALSDKFAALGGVVYEIIKKPGRSSIKANAKVKKLVAEIARLEAQLRAKKTTTGAAKKTRAAKKSATKASGKKPSSRKKTTAKTKAKPKKK
jgi:predicted sulfurtransferase